MRLVDDDRVVGAQETVAPDLIEQKSVSEQLDRGCASGAVIETNGVTYLIPELDLELLGDSRGHRTRGEPARLRVPDSAADTATKFQTDLGNLSCLTRTRFAGDDDDLIVADRVSDIFAPS